MIFSSVPFLFAFLPVVFAVTVAMRARFGRDGAVIALILASIVFYLDWNPPDILYVIAIVVVNFWLVRGNLPPRAKVVLCVLLNGGYLLIIKIAVSGGVNVGAKQTLEAFALPLAISFVVFEQISYVVDRVENRASRPRFLDYLFFVTFFPHLIAGPIVRYSNMIPQIYRRAFLRVSPTFLAVGFTYLAIGLAKKALIADPIARENQIFIDFAGQLTPVEAWLNTFLYSFRIYFDFSGYADMAVGLGYLFGIQLPMNFKSPYLATNIAQFWRRWHISLYRFFRDYIYLRLLRNSFFSEYSWAAVIVVIVISSVWHGVGWGFAIWGLGHGALLLLYRAYAGRRRRGEGVPSGLAAVMAFPPIAFAWRWICIGTTFFLVTILWIPFQAPDPTKAMLLLSSMTDVANFFHFTDLPVGDRHHLAMLLVGLVVVFLLPNSHQIALSARTRFWPVALAVVLFMSAVAPILVSSANPSRFVYFQF